MNNPSIHHTYSERRTFDIEATFVGAADVRNTLLEDALAIGQSGIISAALRLVAEVHEEPRRKKQKIAHQPPAPGNLSLL